MAITENSVVSASTHQVSAEVGEETIVLELERGIYFGLDGVGARVWQLLAEPVTVAHLVRAVCDEYDVRPERCRRDLLALLARLEREGLVEVRANRS